MSGKGKQNRSESPESISPYGVPVRSEGVGKIDPGWGPGDDASDRLSESYGQTEKLATEGLNG